MPKRGEKLRRIPMQIFWDEETKRQFKALVAAYDPLLPITIAVLKLVNQAIKDHWIPGYIRKEKRVDNTVTNPLTRALDNLGETTIKD